MNPLPAVYNGLSKQLVVAFDVGTTFSGVSFSILEPGAVPRICSVTKYPGQTTTGSSKIPTAMYYDQTGRMKCAGAETTLPENVMDAEDGEWVKVEWFKLRLRPPSVLTDLDDIKLPNLPTGKSITQVFADYLGYLMDCTENFIKDANLAITEQVWITLRQNMVIVLAHPNGWEGAQQQQMRQSAIMAQIIPDTPSGHERVNFVTEGEASLHYCIRGAFIDDTKKGFVVADLGGGTLDFSAYKVRDRASLTFEEMDIPKCILEGSIFVTQRATKFLKGKLEGSIYDDPDIIHQVSQKFDESTKITFRAKSNSCIVACGSLKDQDKEHGIIRGQLKLTGEEVASFFEPSITAAVKAICEYIQACPIEVLAVYLVGGFSSSPYLKSEVHLRLQSHNVKVATPDGQVVKAVADGAASYYIDHFVTGRVARASYGMMCYRVLDESREDHKKRITSTYTGVSGTIRVPEAFNTIMKKGTIVHEKTEFREDFYREYELDAVVAVVEEDILAYHGPGEPPLWLDEMRDQDKQKLCHIKANMSGKKGGETETVSISGKKYKKYSFDIVLLFGGPEFKAQISWMEEGVEKRGPAEIIYEDLVPSCKSEFEL